MQHIQHLLSFRRLFLPVLTAFIALAPAARAQQPPAGPPPVTVAQPFKKEVVDWSEFTGQYAAIDNVELRARVSGYLMETRFTDGQMVKKGDLLFIIDPRPYEIALHSAKAKMEQANATLELANRQLGRAGELRQKDFLAQSTYDQRIQDVRGAAASVDVARAAVRDAELNLEFTRVTAPISGRIGARQVSVGTLISGGGTGGALGTLLTTIVLADPVYFNFDMSEADYLTFERAANGKLHGLAERPLPVKLRLADETDWTRDGGLNFIDNQVDRNAGTIRARAVLPNPVLFITPGTFGRIRLAGSEPYQALLIPDSAIMTDQSRKIALAVAQDGTVVPKPLRLGPMVDGLRVVRSGLAPEDQVVISGLLRARPGTKVTPQPGAIQPEQPGQKPPAAAPAAAK
ncbi:MAG: efflux RND transporter periplasmic adaptor subunit [Rhodospirillales bacterium]|nr:efflux RND transporter periplasmic adaptor subunit [Rhodospirillales bacterium]